MSERWKHQIKKGLPFGIIMPVAMIGFDWYGSSETFAQAFISKKFLTYLLVFMFFGIFAVGYASWREVRKNNEYNGQK